MGRWVIALAMLAATAAPARAETMDVEAGLPIGRHGICSLGEGARAPMTILARAGRVAVIPGVGNVVVSHATRRPVRNVTVVTHRAPLPVDTAWHGLPLRAIVVIATSIQEGDSWAQYRLEFDAPADAVRRRLAVIGHPIPKEGVSWDEDAVPPYGAVEIVAATTRGSALVCSQDG